MPSNRTDQQSTAELLSRVLGYAGPSGTVRAGLLLSRTGGRIRLLAEGGGAEGIRGATLARLQAALELGRRAAAEGRERRPRIRGPEDVVNLMAPRLRGLLHEEFHVIILNTRHRVLRVQIVSRGILDASLVHPREVFAPALEDRASAIILVHNHPSGDPDPSPEDRRVTEQLARAGEILGIRVLDHLVIGDPGWASVPNPESGLLLEPGAGMR